MVGLSEFFNNEVPEEVRSFGESWFSSNLNRAHLDYFYWLLAGLCMLALGLYVHLSISYVYRAKR